MGSTFAWSISCELCPATGDLEQYRRCVDSRRYTRGGSPVAEDGACGNPSTLPSPILENMYIRTHARMALREEVYILSGSLYRYV